VGDRTRTGGPLPAMSSAAPSSADALARGASAQTRPVAGGADRNRGSGAGGRIRLRPLWASRAPSKPGAWPIGLRRPGRAGARSWECAGGRDSRLASFHRLRAWRSGSAANASGGRLARPQPRTLRRTGGAAQGTRVLRGLARRAPRSSKVGARSKQGSYLPFRGRWAMDLETGAKVVSTGGRSCRAFAPEASQCRYFPSLRCGETVPARFMTGGVFLMVSKVRFGLGFGRLGAGNFRDCGTGRFPPLQRLNAIEPVSRLLGAAVPGAQMLNTWPLLRARSVREAIRRVPWRLVPKGRIWSAATAAALQRRRGRAGGHGAVWFLRG